MRELVKRVAKRVIPAAPRSAWRRRSERRSLDAVARVPVDTTPLSRSLGSVELGRMFTSTDIAADWQRVSDRLAAAGIGEASGGINRGDRRALYYLIRSLRPRSMLEIGTHVGASTVIAALALHDNSAQGGPPATMTTVDIRDVNDERAQPWREFGSSASPREMLRTLGVGHVVTFVTSPSLTFLAGTPDTYEIAFLDGDHSAATVYREVPAAMRVLAPGGLILLHDFFPGTRPLWPGAVVLPGPAFATERLIEEGAQLRVVPLGELPWPTKLGTNVTSLAVVVAA